LILFAKKWQLCLNASKCEAFCISNKCKTIPFDYAINVTTLIWKSTVKYPGVMLQSNLSRSKKFVSAKASKLLSYLRHTLWGATADAKSRAYKCLVRPCLEYACTVWNPYTASNKFTLETVQRHAARWAAGSR